jgi:hypothetical protein
MILCENKATSGKRGQRNKSRVALRVNDEIVFMNPDCGTKRASMRQTSRITISGV